MPNRLCQSLIFASQHRVAARMPKNRANENKRADINDPTTALAVRHSFSDPSERTAMRVSLTPTLTTPHVCLMADPRSLPGLLTICGELTSLYPITGARATPRPPVVPFYCSRIRPGVSPLFARLITYADQFCHSRDACSLRDATPSPASRFSLFFPPCTPAHPPFRSLVWICIVTLYIWYTQ